MLNQLYNLQVATIRRETEDAIQIGFKIPETKRSAFQFALGQYLTINLTIGGEKVRRAYL